MADDPHAVAVLALLTASPNIPAVYDDVVPTSPPSVYVKVYFQDSPSDGYCEDLTMGTVETLYRIIVHCVAGTASGARIVAGNVRAALLDVIPSVSGRIAWPIRFESSLPPQKDESTGRLVQDQIVTYVLKTKVA